MAPISPVSIQIDRPADVPLSQIMNEIRSWLDHKKIEPVEFKPIESRRGTGFELRFRNEDEAKLFRRDFGGSL